MSRESKRQSCPSRVLAGTHVNNPALGYYKAREIVWEPRSSLGMLSVDGELVACGKVGSHDGLRVLPAQ